MMSSALMSPSLFVITYNGSDFCSHVALAGGVLVSFVPMIFILAFLVMFIAVCLCYSRIAFVMRYKLSLKTKRNAAASDTGSSTVASVRTGARNVLTQIMELHNKRKNKVSPGVNDEGQPRNDSRNLDIKTEVETVPQPSGSGIEDPTCSKVHSDVPMITQHFDQKPLYKKNKRESANVESDTTSAGWTEAKIYRTTKIMFFVTMVFVLSWLPTLAMFVIRRLVDYQSSVVGQVLVLFARKAFLINTFTNPFFYIWMSSSFKERTRKTLSTLFGCRCRVENR